MVWFGTSTLFEHSSLSPRTSLLLFRVLVFKRIIKLTADSSVLYIYLHSEKHGKYRFRNGYNAYIQQVGGVMWNSRIIVCTIFLGRAGCQVSYRWESELCRGCESGQHDNLSRQSLWHKVEETVSRNFENSERIEVPDSLMQCAYVIIWEQKHCCRGMGTSYSDIVKPFIAGSSS